MIEWVGGGGEMGGPCGKVASWRASVWSFVCQTADEEGSAPTMEGLTVGGVVASDDVRSPSD